MNGSILEPKTEEELESIVRKAKQNQKKIHIVCSNTSQFRYSDLIGYNVSLKNLNRIIDIDQEKLKVKVQAGVQLKSIKDILHEKKIGLSILGSSGNEIVGEAITLPYYCSGDNKRIFADYVTEITMMLASGEVKTFSKQDNLTIFNAVRCSLGHLGIVLNVELQCEALWNFKHIEFGVKLDNLFGYMDSHLNRSEFFKISWYPHTEHAIVSNASRTKLDVTKKNCSCFSSSFIGNYLFELSLFLSKYFPCLIPWLNKLYYNRLYTTYSKRHVHVEQGYNEIGHYHNVRQVAHEYSIPRKEITYYLAKIKSQLENNRSLKVHLGFEISFVKADEIWLSPCYQQDSCILKIISFKPFGREISIKQWLAMNESLVKECGGRPNMLQEHNLKDYELMKVYPKLNDFNTLCKEFDPRGMFSLEKC